MIWDVVDSKRGEIVRSLCVRFRGRFRLEDIEDFYSDACMVLLVKLEEGADVKIKSVGGWMYRSVFNLCLRKLRDLRVKGVVFHMSQLDEDIEWVDFGSSRRCSELGPNARAMYKAVLRYRRELPRVARIVLTEMVKMYWTGGDTLDELLELVEKRLGKPVRRDCLHSILARMRAGLWSRMKASGVVQGETNLCVSGHGAMLTTRRAA